MPAITSRAPGKAILFGEHAVVYGHGAIAVPIFQREATTYITANPLGKTGEVLIEAPDVGLKEYLANLESSHPFSTAIHLTMKALKIDRLPACTIRILSSIPIASGLGSGAAIAVSLVRSIAIFLGHPLPDEEISRIAYEVDRFYHGNPSGIDNTVITYEKPVYFIKNIPFEFIPVNQPFDLIIADTGVKSSTREMVEGVASRWSAEPGSYNEIFSEIGSLSVAAKKSIESGDLSAAGNLMNQNQVLLQRIGVSHPALEDLIKSARNAGALGAKLSGAGGGGNMIALSDPEHIKGIETSLAQAGAVNVIHTRVGKKQG
jgi:mevalonate kinase